MEKNGWRMSRNLAILWKVPNRPRARHNELKGYAMKKLALMFAVVLSLFAGSISVADLAIAANPKKTHVYKKTSSQKKVKAKKSKQRVVMKKSSRKASVAKNKTRSKTPAVAKATVPASTTAAATTAATSASMIDTGVTTGTGMIKPTDLDIAVLQQNNITGGVVLQ